MESGDVEVTWRNMKRQNEACDPSTSFCLTPGCKNHVRVTKRRRTNPWSVDYSPFTYTQCDPTDSSESPLSHFHSPSFLFDDSSSDPSPISSNRENIPPGICTPESSGRRPSWLSTPKLLSRKTCYRAGASTPVGNHPAILVGRKRLFELQNETEEAPGSRVQALGWYPVNFSQTNPASKHNTAFVKASVPPLPLHYPMNDTSPREVARELLKKGNEDVADKSLEDVTDEIIKCMEKSQESSPPRSWPQCVICLDKKANTLVFRCGHLCMCYGCAEEQWLGTGRGTCPICRNTIQQLLLPQ